MCILKPSVVVIEEKVHQMFPRNHKTCNFVGPTCLQCICRTRSCHSMVKAFNRHLIGTTELCFRGMQRVSCGLWLCIQENQCLQLVVMTEVFVYGACLI